MSHICIYYMSIYKHWLVVDLVTKLCPTLGTPWTVPVKLLCLLDFLGKSTGVGCNFLLQCIHTHTHTHTHTHIYKCVLIYVCYICMITLLITADFFVSSSNLSSIPKLHATCLLDNSTPMSNRHLRVCPEPNADPLPTSCSPCRSLHLR